ncbi:MAG: hypothetical protein H6868_09075 [Rhodospirillales bacterium]|nr:hypothetical protein [Rhodospirillales bacterium]
MEENDQSNIEREIARKQVANAAWEAFQKTSRLKKADYIAHLGIVLPSLLVPGIPDKYRAVIFAATVLTNAIRSHAQTSRMRKDFNEHLETLTPLAQSVLVGQKAAFDMFSPEIQAKPKAMSGITFVTISSIFAIAGAPVLGIVNGASLAAIVKNYSDHIHVSGQRAVARETYRAVTRDDVTKQKTKPFPHSL